MHLRDLDRFGNRRWREDRRQPAGKHRLPSARQADHQDVVATSGGDFQGTFGGSVTTDIRPVQRRQSRRWNGRDLYGGPLLARLEQANDIRKRCRGACLDALDGQNFRGVTLRAENAFQPQSLRQFRHGQHAWHRADAASQRQLTDDQPAVEGVHREHAIGHQDGQGHGKVKAGAVLAEIGWGQVDDNAGFREGQVAVADGRPDADTGFSHGQFRKANRVERRKTACDVALDVDGDGVNADEGGGQDSGEHGSSPCRPARPVFGSCDGQTLPTRETAVVSRERAAKQADNADLGRIDHAGQIVVTLGQHRSRSRRRTRLQVRISTASV